MSDLEMKALVKFGEEYKQYATVNGQANPSATTHQQMQHLFGNWSDILERMVANMWQPNTAYELNQVVWTPSMPANMVAICTNAGASGAAEPTWPTLVNNTVTDGAAVWSMVAQVITGESPLGINQGGTGATTVAGARNALGLGNTDGAMPIANGGTGATTASQARANLDIGDVAIEATDYIIESYRNGTEWYEVYKSGKVRQGGYIAPGTSADIIKNTITFLRNFKDNSYLLFVHVNSQKSNTNPCTNVGALGFSGSTITKNTTQATIRGVGYAFVDGGYDWIAEGQGA